MSEPTYRCGWRYHRPTDEALRNFTGDASLVQVRRGQWRMFLAVHVFDAMSDEEFAESAFSAYRSIVFERLEADLDVLARQLVGELEQGNGLPVTGVPYDDVKAVLYRWQKAKRDMEEPTP